MSRKPKPPFARVGEHFVAVLWREAEPFFAVGKVISSTTASAVVERRGQTWKVAGRAHRLQWQRSPYDAMECAMILFFRFGAQNEQKRLMGQIPKYESWAICDALIKLRRLWRRYEQWRDKR